MWFARAATRGVLPATWKGVEFRKLRTVEPKLSVSVERAERGVYLVKLRSDVFAHAVHLALPPGAEPEDDYFDLLPGESRTVRVRSPRALTARHIGAHSVHSV